MDTHFLACQSSQRRWSIMYTLLFTLQMNGNSSIMAMRHRTHRTYGLQFHPESFRSEHGPLLLANFMREVA